ncbi:MAG: hypothetical protein IKY76_03305 [Alistipes sp.]|nr:hypothetical protein [Alistipes sp.]
MSLPDTQRVAKVILQAIKALPRIYGRIPIALLCKSGDDDLITIQNYIIPFIFTEKQPDKTLPQGDLKRRKEKLNPLKI